MTTVEMKKCAKCEDKKLITEFYKYHSKCKTCYGGERSEYCKKNRLKRNQYYREKRKCTYEKEFFDLQKKFIQQQHQLFELIKKQKKK